MQEKQTGLVRNVGKVEAEIDQERQKLFRAGRAEPKRKSSQLKRAHRVSACCLIYSADVEACPGILLPPRAGERGF